MVAGEIRLARGAGQVAGAASHEGFEVCLLEALDRTLFCFGKRTGQIERAALGLAAAKAVSFTGDVGDSDAAVFAESRCPHQDVAKLANVAGERPAPQL